jgi:hypothetical protein
MEETKEAAMDESIGGSSALSSLPHLPMTAKGDSKSETQTEETK